MVSPLFQAIPALLGTWILWRFVRRLVVKDPLANIAGPEPDNFVTGTLARLLDKRGQAYNDELAEKYGRVMRFSGPFGRTNILVYDPKAIQHVLVKDQHIWEQSHDFTLLNTKLFGLGLLSTVGVHHRKQRKLLNPAFSTAQMRELTPLFYDVVHKLHKTLKRQVAQGEKEVSCMSMRPCEMDEDVCH